MKQLPISYNWQYIFTVLNEYLLANSPTTVPRVLNTPQTNAKTTVIKRSDLFFRRALTDGTNGSFITSAEAEGGVLGLS